MVPTMVTGWRTWKNQYNAAEINLFRTKIAVSFAMLAISLLLSLWRMLHFVEFLYGVFADPQLYNFHHCLWAESKQGKSHRKRAIWQA